MMNKRQLDNLSPELEDHLKYAIIIDAGSSGTRIQIYSWIDTNFLKEKIKNTEKNEYLKYITDDGLPVIGQGSSSDNFDYQLKIEGGISSYENKVKDIDEHIKYIMDYAESVIPKNKYEETEVYLFATAGMRLLSLEKQEEILNEIYGYMKDNYKFKIRDRKTNIRVITGEEEGLFGWISANYLKNGFSVDSSTNEHQTYNFIDMGGASTQIAFELDKKIKVNGKTVDPVANAKENKSDKNIISLSINNLYGDSLDYNVFVITFLEYGVNETRRRYLESFLNKKREDENYQKQLKAYQQTANSNQKSKREEGNTNTNATPEVKDEQGKIIWEDVCLPVACRQDEIGPLDYKKMFGEVEGEFIEKNVIIKGTGNYDQCTKDIFPLLNSTQPCSSDSCLFNNIYSPYTEFNDEKFIAIGKFFDVVDSYKLDNLYDNKNFTEASTNLCRKEWPTLLASYQEGQYPNLAKPYDMALNCFRSAYIDNVFHQGYKIPKENNTEIPLEVVQYINGVETSWALGALISKLSQAISGEDPEFATSGASSSPQLRINFGSSFISFIIFFFMLFVYIMH
ncbi:nucleoside phosphatase GDA1/CD39 [Neocallimastix lanati (nom. inval.)]|nr:nucleoside phosphatase GDA1/CD39 [Neocallimastix sp. JGI-2020a]